MSWWKKFKCALAGHPHREALGSTMGRRGPRFLYRCRTCGVYFTEPW